MSLLPEHFIPAVLFFSIVDLKFTEYALYRMKSGIGLMPLREIHELVDSPEVSWIKGKTYFIDSLVAERIRRFYR